MHLVRMRLGGVPPFMDPITLKFDERVNVFIGPNASGKSTVLQALAERLIGIDKAGKRPLSTGVPTLSEFADDEFDEFIQEEVQRGEQPNVISASEDWFGTKYEYHRPEITPAVVHIGPVREGLPGISNQPDPGDFGDTSEDILAGPFSGSRTMAAGDLLGKELRLLGDELRSNGDKAPYGKLQVLGDAGELADACSQRICHEVIRDAKSHNYIPDIYSLNVLHDPHADPNDINILRRMGINTTDKRNFDGLSDLEQPARSLYKEDSESPIYLGHTSSGTEGTLLWIRWLALKMVHHYNFDRGSERLPGNLRKYKDGWEQKPAILLIDEIENHLHPTWQRRVIPALLEHFPGLQIFATTHSPFVVAGLRAGQVHLLSRDEHGVVTATTNPEDVIGWTADEILRTMMGVDEPTDQLTVDRANQLRELREKETLTEEEESELNELRRQVNSDFLSKIGPLEAQRERYADLMERFLRSRQSDLTQDGE